MNKKLNTWLSGALIAGILTLVGHGGFAADAPAPEKAPGGDDVKTASKPEDVAPVIGSRSPLPRIYCLETAK